MFLGPQRDEEVVYHDSELGNRMMKKWRGEDETRRPAAGLLLCFSYRLLPGSLLSWSGGLCVVYSVRHELQGLSPASAVDFLTHTIRQFLSGIFVKKAVYSVRNEMQGLSPTLLQNITHKMYEK